MFIKTLAGTVLAFMAVTALHAQSPSLASPKMSQGAVQNVQPAPSVSAPTPFEILKVQVEDSWAKTQIEVSAALTQSLTETTRDQITSHLMSLYADKPMFERYMRVSREGEKVDRALLEKQTGISFKRFRFTHENSDRNEATHFYAMVYANAEEAKSLGNWIGRLTWKAGDKSPEIQVKDTRIEEARQPTSLKFGLSLPERQNLYKLALKLEGQIYDEASERFPNDGMKQADYVDQIRKARKMALAAKYRITYEQFQTVTSEGVEKGWPR